MSENAQSTFEIVLREASQFLLPLGDACRNGAAGITGLAAEAGLPLDVLLQPGSDVDLGQIANDIDTVYAFLRPIAENGAVQTDRIPELLGQLAHLLRLADTLKDVQFQNDVPAAFRDMGRALLDYLLIRYLKTNHPGPYCAMLLAGIIDPGGREDRLFPAVMYERIPRLVTDLPGLMEEVYGWGTDDFDSDSLLSRAHGLLWYLGMPAHFAPGDAASSLAGAAVSSRLPYLELRLPLLTTERAGAVAELGLSVLRLKKSAAASPGLGIVPFGVVSASEEFEAGDSWHVSVSVSAGAVVPWGVSFRPEGLSIGAIGNSAPPATAQLRFLVEHRAEPQQRTLLLGTPNASRIEIGSIGMLVGLDLGADPDILGELPLKGLRLVVSAGEGDGFLQKVLPAEPLAIEFDLTLGLSRKRGLYFSSAGLGTTLRINRSFGPVFVNSIEVAVPSREDRAELVVAATGGIAVGPFTAVVHGIGMRARLEPGKPGLLGSADLSIGFKPPSGIGLSLDTPTVRAAGFILFDPDHERYAGALELSVLKKLDLTAIGLLTTRMPDGSRGFSLLIIISLEFPTPIFLAYNFYLAGIGGLLGLNRTIDIDRMRNGLQAGAVDSVLFPKDIVRRMDAIVTDLSEIFPPERDQFLIGPMALISWNTPPLIKVKLGLIIEFANPVRVAILGLLRAALPTEEEPLLDLKVAFLGAIDFEVGMLSFDASIYDSYIGKGDWKFRFEGDIALRLSWGKQKDFVVTVGGFHPLFSPPAHLKLPPVRRITLSLLKDNPRLTLATYFAITTNTVQFGARLDFYFKVSEFSVVGVFGFDVLCQFDPFRFLAQVTARMSVRMGSDELMSLMLEFQLQGPAPWIAKGTASFKLLFIKVSVAFEKRFGEESVTALPEVEVLGKLRLELGRDANWKGEPAAGGTRLVRLVERPRAAGEIVLDAGAVLTVSQNLVPLNRSMSRFGNSRPSDVQQVRITDVRFGAESASTITDVVEQFAPAQFQDLTDAEKLEAAAFESMPSGAAAVAGSAAVAGGLIVRTVVYERLLSDVAPGAEPERRELGKEADARERFERLARGGAIGHSPASRDRAVAREEGSVLAAAAQEERFVVVDSATLRPLDDGGEAAAGPASLARSAAEARLRKLVALGRPADDLQVVPEAQLAA